MSWFKFMFNRLFINDGKVCVRVGYDLYECNCKECIELDIKREEQL